MNSAHRCCVVFIRNVRARHVQLPTRSTNLIWHAVYVPQLLLGVATSAVRDLRTHRVQRITLLTVLVLFPSYTVVPQGRTEL